MGCPKPHGGKKIPQGKGSFSVKWKKDGMSKRPIPLRGFEPREGRKGRKRWGPTLWKN